MSLTPDQAVRVRTLALAKDIDDLNLVVINACIEMCSVFSCFTEKEKSYCNFLATIFFHLVTEKNKIQSPVGTCIKNNFGLYYL